MSSDIEYMIETGITDSQGNVNQAMMGSMEDMMEDLMEFEAEEAQLEWEAGQINEGVNKREMLDGGFVEPAEEECSFTFKGVKY